MAAGVAVAITAAAIAVSGGSGTDPRTPAALPGTPPPFLGTAVIGHGRMTAAVDAYGNVVDLRAPGPAGRGLIEVSAERQAAGSVPSDAGIVARGGVDAGRLPFWRADSVAQSYLPGTNVLRTVARFGEGSAVIVRRIGGLAAVRADRRWVARATQLGPAAPPWARRFYQRSLLVLRALTDRRTGAVAAGARDGWAYVWPRDAGAVAIALASAGYRAEARAVARFLSRLDLGAAARFSDGGDPVGGRAAQGDAAGWVEAAGRGAGLHDAFARARRQGSLTGIRGRRLAFLASSERPAGANEWRRRADYQEKSPGDYLGNAIASGLEPAQIRALFATPNGLTRRADDPASGLDAAAAWAVRPFPRPTLFPMIRRTLLRLAGQSGRFGIVPSEDWSGGDDPWTAPTAWTAWSLAALGERRASLDLLGDLRRAATPTGMLPERVDAQTGLPASTTPLAWSHAFAVLALRELWPGRACC